MSFGAAGPFAYAGDLIGNSAMMSQQNQYNKESQNRAFSQSLDAQAQAPVNYVSGLRSAGLPLSLALHGAFQTSSAPSPLPVSSHPVSGSGAVLAEANISQAISQAKLVDAEADNLRAKTENQELQNTRIRDENFSLDSSIRGQLMAWSADSSNPARQAAANLMLDSNELYTKGTAEGLKYWQDVVDRSDEVKTNLIIREFTRILNQEMKRNGALTSLADVPNYDVAKLAREIVLLEKEASKVTSETDVNKARLDEIGAHVLDLLESKDLKYSQDLVKQFKIKDKAAVFINLFGKAVNAAAAGAGFAVGTRVAGGKGGVAKSAAAKSISAPSLGSHFKEKYRQTKFGYTKETWRTPFPAQ